MKTRRTGRRDRRRSFFEWTQVQFRDPMAPRPRRLGLELLEDRRLLAVFVVENLNDFGDGSLRWAIEQANANFAADTIEFAVAGTISPCCALPRLQDFWGGTLIDGTTAPGYAAGGEPVVVLDGSSATEDITGLTVDSNNNEIRALKIQSFDSNGILNFGELMISDSTLSGNAAYFGGGIGNNGGIVWITSSTLSGNTASQSGGGIGNNGGMVGITSSTLSGNSADIGGGIVNQGTVTIIHSTLSGNTADLGGGGLYSYGSLNLGHTILAGNTAPLGPDGYNEGGSVTSLGYNLVGDGSDFDFTHQPGDQVGAAAAPIDPRLEPLQDNGGPTWTHELLPGSPAIDAGDPNLADPPETDQRGFPRVFDGDGDGTAVIDIGAFEAAILTAPRLTPWDGADVGLAADGGSYSCAAGVHTIDGGGHDIWLTADEFHYAYQALSGDGEIIARVNSIENTHEWAKAGVMIRETLAPDSTHAMVVLTPGNGVSFQRRTETGGDSLETTDYGRSVPYWVMLVRSHGSFAAFHSGDGSVWEPFWEWEDIPMRQEVYIGLAVTSHTNTAICTAEIDNVKIDSEPITAALPNFQYVGLSGRYTDDGTMHTVVSNGWDISERVDEFHYSYQRLIGDGEIVARVVSVEDTDPRAKAGVMIRETLAADSKHAMVAVTPGNGVSFQRRSATGGDSLETNDPGPIAPYWVKLVRSGDTLTGYHSANGTSWTLQGSETIPMSQEVYIGLAVTSHNDTLLCTAEFDSVQTTGNLAGSFFASDVTCTTARLHGALGCDSGLPTTVYAVWGDEDAGTTAAPWDHSTSLGAQEAGGFEVEVVDLAPGTEYYARFYAENLLGTDWLAEPITFTTPPQADLAIAKTDGQVVAVPDGPLTYTVTVTNEGPNDVTGATVTDIFPVQLVGVTWTGAATPGSSCTPSGTGDIHDTIDLLAGGTVTYTATGTLDAAATGTPTNRATVAVPAGYEDPVPENNAVSDTDTLILPATGGSGRFTDSGQRLGDSVWPGGVALGDLDADGDLDAFLAEWKSNVWLNDGLGGFSDSGQDLFHLSEEEVALGDVDADGDLDAFVAVGYFNGPSPNKVWLNDGQGRFSGTEQSPWFTHTSDVALGDLDGDGDLDAFLAERISNICPVLANDGQGHFTYVANATGVHGAPSAVALGDLNGDGDLDAFVACEKYDDGGLGFNEVFINDGQGNFANSEQDLGNSWSRDVALGDLDGDGDLDAFVANRTVNRVWLNDGQGQFSDSGQGLGDSFSDAVTLGDVDGDGDLDAFVANWFGGNRVWLNDGQGQFSDSGQMVGTAGYNVALGDLDGDGDLDAFLSSQGASEVWVNLNFADVAIAKTDGQVVAMPGGPLTYTVTVTNDGPDDVTGASVMDIFPVQLVGVTWTGAASPGSSCTPSGTGDIHDTVDLLAGGTVTYTATGTLDAAATGTPTNRATVAVPAGCEDPVPENNAVSDTDTLILPATGGSGRFIDSGHPGGSVDNFAVALGDLDGDSDLDAFVGTYPNIPNEVWLNNGQAQFLDTGQRLGGMWTRAVALGDVDADGDLDALAGNGWWSWGQPNKLWLNDGLGNFSDSGQDLGSSSTSAVALGDLDGDGDLDALVGNGNLYAPHGQPNEIWVNDGQGQFTDSGQALGDSWSYAIGLGDLDGDGDLDVFVGNEGANKVWVNDGQGTFSDSGQALGDSSSHDVALGDVDGDGDLDAFVANVGEPKRVWLNDGQAQFTDSGQVLGTSASHAVALADLDGDGDLDAFVGNEGANQVWVNDGQGTFSDSGQALGSALTRAAALGDLDGDGDLDGFAGNAGANRVWLNVPITEVVGRHIFYNHSDFDGNNAAANPQDDDAIAPDKQALLPGQTATFANYTSYSRGINGIMVDIADPDGTPTVDDFRFKVGNDSDLASWTAVTAMPSIAVRPGAGIDDSDRVTIVWPDNAIHKQWLQVTVVAGGNTGLAENHVFYFGNAIGESGNSATDAKVNATDMLGARNNMRSFIDPAPLDFDFDYNRDARVNAYDMLIARNNQTSFVDALNLITVPARKAPESTGKIEDLSARDIVLRQAVAEKPEGREDPSAKLYWLYEFEQTGTQKRSPGKNRPAAAAVDRLLGTFAGSAP